VDSVRQTLYDPRNGDLALKVADLADADLSLTARTNYFTIYWIQAGQGTFWADSACHAFADQSLLFFVPYQNIRLEPVGPVRGLALQFHANFLCIVTYHHEVGCDGILFNDLYGLPVVQLDERHRPEIANLFTHIRRELDECGLAHCEVLLSYLKILLVQATRLKVEQQDVQREGSAPQRSAVLVKLRELLEASYQKLHGPADYARLLHMTPRALGKLVKEHLGKTLSELIRERIVKQARWDLIHTSKPVKQIAHELGFDDELYFSRLFKRATGSSPTPFREFETAIRSKDNLSILPPVPSIPSGGGAAE
jgi:AraC-like DNA-binding protein